MKHRTLIIVITITILLTVLPYLIASAAAGEKAVFEGFLLNPIDGNSYLAKMQLGWEGQWKFTLPYNPDPGGGAYLFLFYIFLGHISRLFNLSNLLIFHLARVVGTVFLIITLYVFAERVFSENQTWARRVFIWICLGAGMGWVLFPFGIVTSDLWVPEAYVFLSSYVNPHFPLGVALLIWIFLWSERAELRFKFFMLLAGLALGIVFPFGVVVGAAVLVVLAGWQWLETKRIAWHNPLALILGGGLFVAYQFWVSTTDPILAGWNAQNLTPSPPLWDLVISFSPAILFSILAFRHFRSWKFNYFQKLAVCWFIASLILILFPFSLQRRFLMGFYIPVIILAGIGIPLLTNSLKTQRRLYLAATLLSIPSILVVLALGAFGIATIDQRFYISNDEQKALTWVGQSTTQNAIFLASPDIGNIIPAQTGRRVLYGHPFETINAEAQKQQVIDLYRNTYSAADSIKLLKELNVSYVFYGPRERILGRPDFINHLQSVFQDQDVTIYAVN
jgi:hypothetical protein